MILSDKETTVIKDLQTQEQSCVEKYQRYSKLAKDQLDSVAWLPADISLINTIGKYMK